jgi:hypothetical protein
MNEPIQDKPRRGRPPKIKAEAPASVGKVPSRPKMKAKPNWVDLSGDENSSESPDRLHIDRSLIPDGMDLQWVTISVFGQAVPQRRADFEKGGWTPVHQEDFDGQFNGMFMPKDADGEIVVDGLVLMARPLELSKKAKLRDRRRANETIQIKEAALRGGELSGVTLDGRHPTAVNSNRINKSIERISIPED